MNRLQLIQRVRANTRDFSNSIFREPDIIDYLNEGINRCKQIIIEFSNVLTLLSNAQEVILIPEQYHHLLALYASSKCFAQDERHYQASTLMNEFEVKLQELLDKIESGEVVIKDVLGVPIVIDSVATYVDLSYYDDGSEHVDLDLGVGGLVT